MPLPVPRRLRNPHARQHGRAATVLLTLAVLAALTPATVPSGGGAASAATPTTPDTARTAAKPPHRADTSHVTKGSTLLGAEPLSRGAKPLRTPPATSSRLGPLTLSLRPIDPAAAAKTRVRSLEGEGDGDYVCTEYVDYATGQVGLDDYLEETGHVDYAAEVDCNFYLDELYGVAGVFDRSRDFNGQSFDGTVLGTGNVFDNVEDYFGFSQGSLDLSALAYDGGRDVEPGIEVYLLAPEGLLWGDCGPLPGLRYLACDGLGTDLLHVVVGTGPVSTGLTTVCRDVVGQLHGSEKTLIYTTFGGPAPASTQILRLQPAVLNDVVQFKHDLCTDIGSVSGGLGFAANRGLRLWRDAVAARGDDRPLYWGRLVMDVALDQYRPSFGASDGDRAGLQAALERPSRGMTDETFGNPGVKKVFVSGYDPFGFFNQYDIRTGNPSGAAALAVDGTFTNGAEIQAVIFPVRYADFNNGLVEDVFRPHMVDGGQKADLITTVSQGSDNGVGFDLEYWNGRRRDADPFRDNDNQLGGGTRNNPTVPPGLDPGAEFVPTTLPVGSMLVGNVIIDRHVVEIPAGQSSPVSNDNGPDPGATAVEGGGGGFLSNEIAYRVTRLRDAVNPSVPAGHIHTPALGLPGAGVDDPGFAAQRSSIVAQYRAILNAAITA